MPKISVIIPVYNTQTYLRRCLDSVCKQTLSDIEIICVNDGSTDASFEILEEYAKKDSRIELINFKKNKGVSTARNAAIKKAQGEYIGFVDSDDFIDLDFYEKLYEKAEETDSDIVKGSSIEISYTDKKILKIQNQKILENKMYFVIGWVSAIYRANLINENKITFSENLLMGEDDVFLNQALTAAKKVTTVDSVSYHYCRRGESANSKRLSKEKVDSATLAYEIIIDNINNTKNSILDYQIYNYIFDFWFNAIINISFRAEDKDGVRTCSKALIKFYDKYKYCHDSATKLTFNQQKIRSCLINRDIEEFTNYLMKHNTYSELMSSILRYKIKSNSNKVSVIIPVYKVEDYLPKCLDSIINQTYKNLEIICVNDSTPDNGDKILEKYANSDSRISVITNEKNMGSATSRNIGFEKATGKYIYFMDADDWIDANYIEKMVEMIEKSNTDIILNLNMEIISYNNVTKNYEGYPEISEKGDFIGIEKAAVDSPCTAWSHLYTKSFLDKYNLSFPDGLYGPDDKYFQYITHAFIDKLYAFRGPFYHYHLTRENNISETFKNQDFPLIKMYDRLFDYYKEYDLLERNIKIFGVPPFTKIDSEEKFNFYKAYFNKSIEYLKSRPNLYNKMELFFANNVLNSKNYKEYKDKFGENVALSFIRMGKLRPTII